MTMCSQHTCDRPFLPTRGLGVAGTQDMKRSTEAFTTQEKRMRILIADDHLSLLTLLTTFLEESGHEVVTARNGREALACLHHSSPLPGLILLDVAMPEMTGWEFLRQQQRERCLAALPVIL